MSFFNNISLKFKLLIIFVSLSISVLLIYAFLALRDFENDKIAYVLDSILAQSKSSANQIRTDLEFYSERLNFLNRGFDIKKMNFHPFSKSIFRNEDQIKFLATYIKNQETQLYEQKKIMLQGDYQFEKILDPIISQLTQLTIKNKIALQIHPQKSGEWLLALRFGEPEEAHFISVALITKGNFLEPFISRQIQDTYLADSNGQLVLSPKTKSYKNIDSKLIKSAIFNTQNKITSPSGINEYDSKEESETLLVSFSKIGLGELVVFSLVPKSAALEAVKLLVIKSVLFMLLIIFVAIFVSVIAASKLTSSLKKLMDATQAISKGKFDIQVDIHSKDEVGQLAEGFQHMAKEIDRLMGETKEKARMEGELKTAQLVQSTLFPVSSFDFDHISIRGFYESASECGGDWWFYNQVGDKIFLWIGDATGHGVPAALVTSAARSAASILNNFTDITPSELMGLLNQAIYNTAKGQVLMTFFLASYDLKKKELTYCSASHDPPFLIPKANEKLKKKHIIPLMENSGPRLGESIDTQYKETLHKIDSGDKIIFYTDGVTELNDSERKMWGERKFIKTLLDSFNEKDELDLAMNNLSHSLNEFRGDTPLADDVTYFMFQSH